MRPDLMGRYRNCLMLNWRMLGHLLAGRLLSGKEVAAGYDRLAAGYAENWLSRLRPVTEEMFALLPEQVAGNILDLGCGTGFTTAELERRYPATPVRAVDISAGMVAEAERLCRRGNFTVGDMLEFLHREPDGSAGLIVSAWALGYSDPPRLIREAARVLSRGGDLVFVVNTRETLPAVFHAFRRTMAHFPERTGCALFPKFPKGGAELAAMLVKAGFRIGFAREAAFDVVPPEGVPVLEWLLKTGILAGFDAVLPLGRDAEVDGYFTRELEQCGLPLAHHYVMISSKRAD